MTPSPFRTIIGCICDRNLSQSSANQSPTNHKKCTTGRGPITEWHSNMFGSRFCPTFLGELEVGWSTLGCLLRFSVVVKSPNVLHEYFTILCVCLCVCNVCTDVKLHFYILYFILYFKQGAEGSPDVASANEAPHWMIRKTYLLYIIYI
jgi:hypothetical protein